MLSVRNWLPGLKHRKRERRQARKLHEALADLDDEARQTILRVKDCTMLDPEKLYALITAVRYVSKHQIEGDIVECGVWRGGSVMAAALTLIQLGAVDRRFFLYDTFTGMPQPSEWDRASASGVEPAAYFQERQTEGDASDWCLANVEDVRANLATVAYDQDQFILAKGKVEDTIPGLLPGPIAILHLDTDWYASTRHEMEHLMPRVVSKGALIVDDYYYWSGSRDAVDEYLERHQIPVLLTKVGRSAIGVVP